MVGCATSQIPNDCEGKGLLDVPLPGLLICILLSLLSASAGIATEWIMKKSTLRSEPLHLQNVHLYFFGICFCLLGWWFDREEGEGLLEGYTLVTVLIVATYALSGVIISMIMKYADNMVRIYAVAVSMVLTTVVSMMLFGFQPTPLFCFGVIVIIVSILMYFNLLTENSGRVQ